MIDVENASSNVGTEYEAAFAHGAASAPLLTADGSDFALIPRGYVLQDLENFAAAPKRIRTAVTLDDAASFIAYVNAFKDPGATQIFAGRKQSTVTARLDYHESPDTPSWSTHSATLALRHSPEWTTWTGRNNQPLSQVAFAEFLEDNVGDIAEPAGAAVLEAAQGLEARKTVHFKSGVNLDTGAVQFTFVEDVNGGTAKGQLTVPTRFTLGLAPYVGGALMKVNCRLRYRINDDKLTFTYLIERPHKVLEAAFDAVIQAVADETELTPLFGNPG